MIVDDYIIQHDGRQYILFKEQIAKDGKNKGEKVLKVIGYYPKEVHLLQGMVKHKMPEVAIDNINQVKEMIEQSQNKIIEYLEEK